MSSNVEQLIEALEDLYELIGKARTNYKKAPKVRLSRGYIQARLQCLEEYWSTYRSTHQNLLKITNKEERRNLEHFTDDVYNQCEEIYLELKADMMDALHSLSTSRTEELSPIQNTSLQSENSNTVGVEVKLPRINLPTFSGAYEEWQSFEDSFTALVHKNRALSDVQRLHYLKSCLYGEAQNTIRHLQVTESNYSQAWDMLKNRYSHKRLIVNSILKRLFSFKKINTQSPGQLKLIIDSTKECLNSLNAIDINTVSWDPIIIFLIVQKLDPDTHKDWETYVSQEYLNEMPSFRKFVSFLEMKIHTLELTSHSLNNTQKVIRERSYYTTTIQSSCKLCKGQHFLWQCKEFGKLNLEKRNTFIRENRLCYNCLSEGHVVRYCRRLGVKSVAGATIHFYII